MDSTIHLLCSRNLNQSINRLFIHVTSKSKSSFKIRTCKNTRWTMINLIWYDMIWYDMYVCMYVYDQPDCLTVCLYEGLSVSVSCLFVLYISKTIPISLVKRDYILDPSFNSDCTWSSTVFWLVTKCSHLHCTACRQTSITLINIIYMLVWYNIACGCKGHYFLCPFI